MSDDIDDDEDGIDLFITYSFDVKFIRFIENVMIPTTLDISASIERSDDATDEEVEFAMTKWKYWFDHVVSRSIAFNRENETALGLLLDDDGVNKTGNLFLLTPDDPSDEVLASLFQAKMNALGNGKVFVVSIDIRSDNLHGLSFMLTGNHSIYLPKTIEEWLGGTSYWTSPWWFRNDASSIDIVMLEGLDTPPQWAYSLDFLDRAGRAIKEVIPSRTEFRPMVIEGGKGDDDKGDDDK